MAMPDSFSLFSMLPAELRIQIWTEALTIPTVWAVVLTKPQAVYDGGPLQHRRSIRLTCVGTSPHLAGLSCKEARDVMERIYKRPLVGPFTEAAVRTGVHWVYPETAVVTFVNSEDSLAILDCLDAEISRFRHVALVWGNWRTQPLTCVRLAKSCRALRTLIIQRAEAEISRTWVSTLLRPSTLHEKMQPVVLKLDPVTAAHYAALTRYDGAEIGDAEPSAATYRKSILQYFEESAPRLHVLAPGQPLLEVDSRSWVPGRLQNAELALS
jgi:hypothetical protein